MKKLVLILSILGLMCGCGGGGTSTSTTPPAVAVSITTPTSAQTVPVNGTLAITAAVANTTNTAVTWTVNGVTNGNSTYGTIAGSGLSVTYTAPAAVPATATFNITATSQEDTSKSASVSVTISAGVVVSITTPTGPQNVPVSSTLGITASVTGTSYTRVTWTVNGAPNGNATYGTISGSGLTVTYNAPAAVPPTATFNVTATSAADITKSASVSVTILPVVAVSITTPTGAQSLAVNGTLGITASVTGTSNTGVTWTVNGVTNGNSTYGTISGSGLSVTYTAPAAVPSPATFNVTATSQADTTKSASVSVTILPAVAVSITSPSNLTQSVVVNGTLAITAAVANTSNTAVTWTVNGITNGNATYGTIAGSGLSVTYDAPAAVPSPATFNVTATSVADITKSASVSVTITAAPAVAVSITSPSNLTQSIVVNGTLAITAAVANTSNTAVTWTVNGITNGNSTYGTIAGSGLSVTYDAPAAVPSPATFNVTATSVADTTKSASVSVTITAATAACSGSGNETILSGQYAFSLSGFNATGYLAEVGSFTADGTGKITAGEVDSNGALGVQQADITTSASSYSVGSDNRGCATIVTPFYTFTTRFALGTVSSGIATEGRVIEWETPTSSAYIAAGHILQQTASSFSSGLSSGSYAFEESGVDHAGPIGIVGVISASGGSLTNGEVDQNEAGTISNIPGMTGTYTAADSNGRFTIAMTAPSQVAGSTSVGYIVSSSQSLFMMTLAGSPFVGEMTQQSVPAGGFTNSSLNGTMVFYMVGLNGSGSGGEADIGLASATPATSSLAVTDYSDDAGTWSTPNPLTFTCTYSVASNGRMTLSGGSDCTHAPVFYLTAGNTAFMLDEGSGVEIGQVEPQTGGPFTTASFSGTYYMGTLEVANQAVSTGVGVVTLNGSGGFSDTTDYTATAGQQGDQTGTGTVTVDSNGTFSISDHPGVITGIIISSTKSVTVDNITGTYPTIQVIKQ
jgi:hypothetical protein